MCSIMQKIYTIMCQSRRNQFDLATFSVVFHLCWETKWGWKLKGRPWALQSLLVWPNTRHSQQHIKTPLGTALLVYLKFWPNAGIINVLWNISSLSTCHWLNLVSGCCWQKDEKVSFHFHISNVVGVLLLLLPSAFFFIHSFNWLFNSFLLAMS